MYNYFITKFSIKFNYSKKKEKRRKLFAVDSVSTLLVFYTCTVHSLAELTTHSSVEFFLFFSTNRACRNTMSCTY